MRTATREPWRFSSEYEKLIQMSGQRMEDMKRTGWWKELNPKWGKVLLLLGEERELRIMKGAGSHWVWQYHLRTKVNITHSPHVRSRALLAFPHLFAIPSLSHFVRRDCNHLEPHDFPHCPVTRQKACIFCHHTGVTWNTEPMSQLISHTCAQDRVTDC